MSPYSHSLFRQALFQLSNRPNVHFLRHDAPVGVVVVGRDYVEVVHVAVDQVVELTLSEDVIESERGEKEIFKWMGGNEANRKRFKKQ